MNGMPIRAALLSLLLLPSYALASPPPPIQPGSLKALDICRFGGGYGIAWTNSGNNGKFYAIDSPDLPPALALFAGKGSGIGFRVCTDADKNIHYFARSPGSPDLPACEIFEMEIFPAAEGHVGIPLIYGSSNYNTDYVRVAGWSSEPPKDWQERGYNARDAIGPVVLAQAKSGACPPPIDANYAHVTNVPPDLFKAVADAFQAAKENPASIPTIPGADPKRLSGTALRAVSCTNVDCGAFLSNGYSVTFGFVDGRMAVTKIRPWMD